MSDELVENRSWVILE